MTGPGEGKGEGEFSVSRYQLSVIVIGSKFSLSGVLVFAAELTSVFFKENFSAGFAPRALQLHPRHLTGTLLRVANVAREKISYEDFRTPKKNCANMPHGRF